MLVCYQTVKLALIFWTYSLTTLQILCQNTWSDQRKRIRCCDTNRIWQKMKNDKKVLGNYIYIYICIYLCSVSQEKTNKTNTTFMVFLIFSGAPEGEGLIYIQSITVLLNTHATYWLIKKCYNVFFLFWRTLTL